MEVRGQLRASVALPLGKEPLVPVEKEAGRTQSRSGLLQKSLVPTKFSSP